MCAETYCRVMKDRQMRNGLYHLLLFFLVKCSFAVVRGGFQSLGELPKLGSASNDGKLCKTLLYCLRKFINAVC